MKSQGKSQRPELLAPAGSLEAFFAAAEAGADAIYTGLRDFSARAKAKNFSLADIEQLSHFLQRDGRRLYVTLNTLIKERELPQLIDTLGALEQIGVDAVILQDLAVWKLAREHFPGLELHSSTQLTIHNTAGVKMLERMGFTRAVLARELSLAEIAEISCNTSLELEHFIHGALCFSFSGQCYFSSFLGGKSGNRGRCAQPCRRRHSYRQNQGYYFSTNDLSAIDLLPELAQAGVCSLKIEGRMKSAEYVHQVVGAYRRVLDASAEQRPAALQEAKQRLKESFGRPPTKGFLPGGQPSDIAIPSVKGATGRYLGDVARVRGGEISFKTKDKLHLGDRLRIQPATDKAGTAFTIRQLQLGKRTVKQVPAGSFVSVPSSFQNRFKVGDAVFMVSSSTAFALSDAACRRRLSQVKPPAENVALRLDVSPNQLQIEATVAGQAERFQYAIDSFPAEERGLDSELLQQVFAATAGEPFQLDRFDCGELPTIVIPPKRLKQIRRELYAELRRNRQQQKERRLREHLEAARTALLEVAGQRAGQAELRVQLRDARDQRILRDPLIEKILVPLTGANLQQANRLLKRNQQVIWDIPFIIFDRDWKDSQHAINQLIQAGFRHFRLNNLGHLLFFAAQPEVELCSGFRLFSLNSQAVSAWAELGIDEAELYIEDDRDNLADLLRRKLPVPTAMTVYGSVPLLVSRVAIRNVRADSPVRSDRDDAYRVQQRQGLTWLTSETDFSFISNMNELQGFGCDNFIIDLSHLGPFSAAGKKILEAARRGADPAGTSKFNYLLGME